MREKTPPLCRMRFPGQEFASQQGLGPTDASTATTPFAMFAGTVEFQYNLCQKTAVVSDTLLFWCSWF